MKLIVKKDKRSIKEMVRILETMKERSDIGKVVYNEPVEVVLEEFVVVSFATWVDKLGDLNDSPNTRFVTVEEHEENCDKLISELEAFL